MSMCVCVSISLSGQTLLLDIPVPHATLEWRAGLIEMGDAWGSQHSLSGSLLLVVFLLCVHTYVR